MCWGAGANGRLGDGTTADRVSPAFVLTQGVPLENVVQIAAGHGHVCARQQSGTVHCWGANAQGQLGVGDEVDRLEATPVPGLAGVDEIAAGGMRTCARTGGTVQCWGTNAQGQIGDGTQVASNVPVSVSGLTDATALRLAQNHGFARRQDGTWVGWGMGWSGEVRHGGSPGFILAPVPVVEPGETTTWQGLQSVLAGGHSYGCAVDGDGVTWCWGNNQYGQLGDGAVGGSRSNPEPVKW